MAASKRDATCWCALSVRQPYAHLIVAGIKKFDARTGWLPESLGAVLIHASSSMACGWKDDPYIRRALARADVDDVATLPRGGIIGVVDICRTFDEEQAQKVRMPKSQRHLCAENGDLRGLALIQFAHPAFTRFVKCHGALHLWRVPAPVVKQLNK